MTSKERVLRAIRFEKPDRTPISLRFCPEKWAEIQLALGMGESEALDWMGQDTAIVRPRYKAPASPVHYADPTACVDEQGYYRDIYGVPFRQIDAPGQQYLEFAGIPVLKGPEDFGELDRYPWPSTDDWEYGEIPRQLAQCADRAAWPRARGVLGTAQFMRGMENFLCDMYEDHDYARALMDHIYAFVREDMRRSLEAGNGRYTFAEYNDDLGTQRALMISPVMFQDFVVPYLEDFCALVHSFGAYVRFHSCGAIAPLIDDLIACGVDVLDPVQPAATGMEPGALLKKYCGRLCLHGGLDIQYLLPNGTPEQTRTYVRRLIGLSRDGGYILAGSHTIQSDARTENILAAVDEVMGR